MARIRGSGYALLTLGLLLGPSAAYGQDACNPPLERADVPTIERLPGEVTLTNAEGLTSMAGSVNLIDGFPGKIHLFSRSLGEFAVQPSGVVVLTEGFGDDVRASSRIKAARAPLLAPFFQSVGVPADDARPRCLERGDCLAPEITRHVEPGVVTTTWWNMWPRRSLELDSPPRMTVRVSIAGVAPLDGSLDEQHRKLPTDGARRPPPPWSCVNLEGAGAIECGEGAPPDAPFIDEPHCQNLVCPDAGEGCAFWDSPAMIDLTPLGPLNFLGQDTLYDRLWVHPEGFVTFHRREDAQCPCLDSIEPFVGNVRCEAVTCGDGEAVTRSRVPICWEAADGRARFSPTGPFMAPFMLPTYVPRSHSQVYAECQHQDGEDWSPGCADESIKRLLISWVVPQDEAIGEGESRFQLIITRAAPRAGAEVEDEGDSPPDGSYTVEFRYEDCAAYRARTTFQAAGVEADSSFARMGFGRGRAVNPRAPWAYEWPAAQLRDSDAIRFLCTTSNGVLGLPPDGDGYASGVWRFRFDENGEYIAPNLDDQRPRCTVEASDGSYRLVCDPPDRDEDTVADDDDNCPDVFNPDQADADEDGLGDLCEEGVEGPDNEERVDAVTYPQSKLRLTFEYDRCEWSRPTAARVDLCSEEHAVVGWRESASGAFDSQAGVELTFPGPAPLNELASGDASLRNLCRWRTGHAEREGMYRFLVGRDDLTIDEDRDGGAGSGWAG
jgi:hypothetical protein